MFFFCLSLVLAFFRKCRELLEACALFPFFTLWVFFSPPFWIFLPFLTVFILVTCFIAESMQKRTGSSDPSWVVLDEVLGMFVAWVFMRPHNFLDLGILFVSFRFFDILKPWPIARIDRMKHGAGIMLDDVAAGFYAALIFFLWRLT